MPAGEKRQTILIVDDDRGLLRLMEKSLQREGFVIETASSGKEALAWLSARRPDLLLLDLKLEDIEGHELIRRISETSSLPPFVIITGQGDERVAVEMMKRGARDYLVKDVDFLQFVPEVVRRVLDQLETERRLATAETERKRLQKEILEISDGEKRRIGQDLHDGLCQQLAGIELMSEALAQRISGRSRADAARAAEIAGHVREAIRQTRLLARGLSPVTLESEGLMSGLQELASNTEKMFHVHCRFVCELPVPIPDEAMATHLYRIAQEAVFNAVKHGKASQISIELSRAQGRIVLEIDDNGSGFPDPVPRQKGMGLRIMEYRAAMIGGTLVTQNIESGGGRVACDVAARPKPKRNNRGGNKEKSPGKKAHSHR